MQALPRPTLSAIAFQLAGALEAYQAQVDQVLRDSRSLEHAREAGRRLAEVLRLKGALPQLAAQLQELLACHTALMHVLWTAVRGRQRRRTELVRRHAQVLQAAHARCLRLFSRDAAPT